MKFISILTHFTYEWASKYLNFDYRNWKIFCELKRMPYDISNTATSITIISMLYAMFTKKFLS